LHQYFINRRVESVVQQHQVQGFLAFARALGLDADEPEWDLPVTAASRDFANEALPGEQTTLLINPCSNHASRNCSSDRYATVADHAIDKLGLRVVLAGG
jgi:heptosyltransferase I